MGICVLVVSRQITTGNSTLFMQQVQAIRQDFTTQQCPKLVLTAIEVALQNSLPYGLVLTFLDSTASDITELGNVQSLLEYTKAQVRLVLSLTLLSSLGCTSKF